MRLPRPGRVLPWLREMPRRLSLMPRTRLRRLLIRLKVRRPGLLTPLRKTQRMRRLESSSLRKRILRLLRTRPERNFASRLPNWQQPGRNRFWGKNLIPSLTRFWLTKH